MTLPELIIPNQQRVIYKVLDAGIRPSYINSMAMKSLMRCLRLKTVTL
jgi:hypothetical protein